MPLNPLPLAQQQSYLCQSVVCWMEMVRLCTRSVISICLLGNDPKLYYSAISICPLRDKAIPLLHLLKKNRFFIIIILETFNAKHISNISKELRRKLFIKKNSISS